MLAFALETEVAQPRVAICIQRDAKAGAVESPAGIWRSGRILSIRSQLDGIGSATGLPERAPGVLIVVVDQTFPS
jgi:hypothetical protein